RSAPPRRTRGSRRATDRRQPRSRSFHSWSGVRVVAMPIHLRAEPGDYGEAVLVSGDPLRAKYIAETYLVYVVQVNEERGMLGFRGTWEGEPVSVQATGIGCPSASI